MLLALYITEGLHMCFQTALCGCVCYHHLLRRDILPFKFMSSSRERQSCSSTSFKIKARVCQTFQTQTCAKKHSSCASLMKQGPFKIYERVWKLQWTVITLEFKIVASSLRKWSAPRSPVIKSKEQEDYGISFIRALNYYYIFRSCDMKRKET